jgi:hypothetical protein
MSKVEIEKKILVRCASYSCEFQQGKYPITIKMGAFPGQFEGCRTIRSDDELNDLINLLREIHGLMNTSGKR